MLKAVELYSDYFSDDALVPYQIKPDLFGTQCTIHIQHAVYYIFAICLSVYMIVNLCINSDFLRVKFLVINVYFILCLIIKVVGRWKHCVCVCVCVCVFLCWKQARPVSLSAQRSVMSMMIIPLPHYDKKKIGTQSPPPPPGPLISFFRTCATFEAGGGCGSCEALCPPPP